MLTVDEAQARAIAAARAPTGERVALADAHGRVLMVAARAGRDLPGFDDAAMDGFAVRAADGPGRRPIAGEVAAGELTPPSLAPGTALRITTGAPLPPGADAVVMREDVVEHDAEVDVPAVRGGAHVRRAGEDVSAGSIVLPAGVVLGPGELGLLAALGHAEVDVARRPRVAILATGDELVDVATPPRPGQRVDSSAYALAAQLREAGAEPTYLGVVGDDRAAITARFHAALGHDVVLTTGGVSVGVRDHVKDALADAGAELDFWKVAMKPGKPVAFATVGAAVWFGLPGNPASSMVALELFVRPLLLAMQGRRDRLRPRAPVVMAAAYTKAAGRTHFLRARVERAGARLVAHVLPRQGSGMLSSMVGVDALVEIPAETTSIPAGGVATAHLWVAR